MWMISIVIGWIAVGTFLSVWIGSAISRAEQEEQTRTASGASVMHGTA